MIPKFFNDDNIYILISVFLVCVSGHMLTIKFYKFSEKTFKMIQMMNLNERIWDIMFKRPELQVKSTSIFSNKLFVQIQNFK